MVFPDTILRSVKEAIKSSGRLPDSTTYAVFELDETGGQANVRPPIIEITTQDTVRSDSVNTDFVGYSTDGNGNHVGRIYRAPFEMPIQIDVITAEGDGYDPSSIKNAVKMALYEYEDRQEDANLPDPDGSGVLADVNQFQLMDGQPNNDLGMTPALRGRRQGATVWFEEVIDSAVEYGESEYIGSVVTPADGDAVGSGVEIIFDSTPSESSPADTY